MSDHLASAARAGFHNAGAYDAHRPSYPDAAVDGLLRELGILGLAGEEIHIVEIAAGTGKFTEALSRAASSSSLPWNVIAVEPHDQMRSQLVAKKLQHVTVVNGHAASIPVVKDGWADAVIVAQAFHWFANQEALEEIHRLLKPNAMVGLIWNVEEYNKPKDWLATTSWEEHLNKLIYALGSDGNPRFRENIWKAAFSETPALSQAPLFSPLTDHRVYWTVPLTPDALWQRLLTLSQITNLPERSAGDATAAYKPASQVEFKRRLDAILEGVERNTKGEVTVHALTYYAWTRRL